MVPLVRESGLFKMYTYLDGLVHPGRMGQLKFLYRTSCYDGQHTPSLGSRYS